MPLLRETLMPRPEEAIRAKLAELHEERSTLGWYLEVVIRRGDMHGIMDAAADIRESDATIDALRWVLTEPGVEL